MTNITHIDTVVIGGGQAGIATSEHLTHQGIDHVVLERNRIAERWRSQRWDSLVANGPAWHDRLPGLKFENYDDDDFVSKEHMADYFVDYVKKFNLPIREGVTVHKVTRIPGTRGFVITTSDGTIHADYVVCATGPFQNPIIPPVMPMDTHVIQMHSADYKSPQQVPDGAVLVVGAGPSGTQIADELNRAGRTVYLSVSPHTRPPRSYRNRDFVWWLQVLGIWDTPSPAPGTEHKTAPVSGDRGADGTVDFRAMAHDGIILVGRTESYQGGVLTFKDDLQINIREGDESYLDMLNAMDAHIAEHGLDLPEQPNARDILPDPPCLTNPITQLNIQENNVKSIIWATGFRNNYDWLQMDCFDDVGNPEHHRGISKQSGLYFVGLPFLSCLRSLFVAGCWHDAKYITDHIALHRKYINYGKD